MNIINRQDAAASGMKRYYTGKPCKFGHIAERFVTTGSCVKCNAQRSKLFARDQVVANNCRSAGWFTYPLHPDDHATILAMCQGLDMQRGRKPHIPEGRQLPRPATVVATPTEYTEEMRQQVLQRREQIAARAPVSTTYNDDDLSPEEMAR